MDDTIDWLGHATVRIELDGIRILTDPTIRDRIGPLDRKVAPIPHHEVAGIDVVLVSHLHQDHLDLPSLRRLGDVRLIVPQGSGRDLPGRRPSRRRRARPGRADDATGRLTIEAVRADHSGFRPPFGPTAPALGFVVSSHRRRVYFAGDTALYPEMADIADLDVALLPVWGWGPNLRGGHMDPLMAAEAADAAPTAVRRADPLGHVLAEGVRPRPARPAAACPGPSFGRRPPRRRRSVRSGDPRAGRRVSS